MDRNTLIYIGVGVAIVAVIAAWLVLSGGSAPDATAETPVITTVPPHKLGCG
jgi:hypothetical protein